MAKRISKSRFKSKTLEYLREVERTGEALIITDHRRPVVTVVAYRESQDTLRLLRGCVLRYDDPLESVGDEDWEAAR